MKRGFTLIELIVYMALLGFIIVVAGRVFSDSTAMRVRSQNMIKNSEEVGRVSSLLREDISQMGTKVWGHSLGAGDYTTQKVGTATTYPEIYWNKNNGDLSSYALNHRKDSIAFRKTAFDGDGLFVGIREIVWELKNDSLLRRCATIKNICPSGTCGTKDDDLAVCPFASSATASEIKPVLIAKNVVNFKISPAAPGKESSSDTLFGQYGNRNFNLLARPETSTEYIKPMTTSPTNTGTETTLVGFAQAGGKNHNELCLAKTDKSSFTSFNDCNQMPFKKDETYSIEFKMPFSIPAKIPANAADSADLRQALNATQFVPGRDHLAIGLRKSDGKPPDGTQDILFYPAQSDLVSDVERHLEFSVKENVTACVVIIIAYYPPTVPANITNPFNAANGKLRFRDFKVFRNPDGAFHFPKKGDADYYDGKYGTEEMTPADKKNEQKTKAKAFEVILDIENKGEKSGTILTITTPNNGTVP